MNPNRTNTIPDDERIPFFQKLAFATGVNMDYSVTGMLKGVLWMPVFNIGFGISPITLGIVMMIFRGWDAFTDPLMGNISDNTHTRWGRRRPYMFIGAFATVLLYPLFWFMPIEWSSSAKSIYLTFSGILFFTAFTSWSMPYYGMQLELTPNYDERSRLTAWMAFFTKAFYLGAGWLLPLVMVVGALAIGHPEDNVGKGAFFADFLAPLQSWFSSFPGISPDLPPIVAGIRIVCWLIMLISLCFGLLPALFTKERYYQSLTKKQKREPFWQSIRETLSCKPLWILIAASFLLSFGLQSISTLGQYVNFYYVNHGDLTTGAFIAGWKNTVAVALGFLCLPILVKLGERFDKINIALAVLIIATLMHAMGYFLITPDYPYLQIANGVVETSALGAFYMFLPSMKADVSDYDEYITGRRREGAINAFYSWFVKVAGTMAVGVGGVVLELSGFDATIGDQPQSVLNRMFIMYLCIPILIWVSAIAVLWRFPLNRERARQIRLELEQRRGKA